MPEERAHPDLNQGPADLQSAALTAELCTQLVPCSDVSPDVTLPCPMCSLVARRLTSPSLAWPGIFQLSSADWRKNDSCGVRTHALADWRLKPAP